MDFIDLVIYMPYLTPIGALSGQEVSSFASARPANDSWHGYPSKTEVGSMALGSFPCSLQRCLGAAVKATSLQH